MKSLSKNSIMFPWLFAMESHSRPKNKLSDNIPELCTNFEDWNLISWSNVNKPVCDCNIISPPFCALSQTIQTENPGKAWIRKIWSLQAKALIYTISLCHQRFIQHEVLLLAMYWAYCIVFNIASRTFSTMCSESKHDNKLILLVSWTYSIIWTNCTRFVMWFLISLRWVMVDWLNISLMVLSTSYEKCTQNSTLNKKCCWCIYPFYVLRSNFVDVRYFDSVLLDSLL